MNKLTVKYIVFMFAIVMMFTACGTPTNSGMDLNDVSGNEKTMENLRIPSDFNWKTFRSVTLKLEGTPGVFEVIAENGVLIHRANIVQNQSYEFTIGVASYQREVILKHAGTTRVIDLRNQSTQLNIVL